MPHIVAYVRCEYVTRCLLSSGRAIKIAPNRTGAIFQKVRKERRKKATTNDSPIPMCYSKNGTLFATRTFPRLYLTIHTPYVQSNMSCVSRQYSGCCTNAIIRLVIKLFIQCAYDENGWPRTYTERKKKCTKIKVPMLRCNRTTPFCGYL